MHRRQVYSRVAAETVSNLIKAKLRAPAGLTEAFSEENASPTAAAYKNRNSGTKYEAGVSMVIFACTICMILPFPSPLTPPHPCAAPTPSLPIPYFTSYTISCIFGFGYLLRRSFSLPHSLSPYTCGRHEASLTNTVAPKRTMRRLM